MPKLVTALIFCVPLVGLVSCSDDDGSDVPRNSMTGGTGGSGQGGASMDAGPGGRSGAGGGGSGGASGAAGCPNVILDGGFPEPVTTDAGNGDAGNTDAGISDAGDLDASTNGGGTPGVVSFALDIRPIFVASCSPCHFNENNGGHNIASDNLPAAYAEAVELGQTIVERVNGRGMPPSYAEPPNNCDGLPGDPGCLTVAEVELIRTWLAQCTPR